MTDTPTARHLYFSTACFHDVHDQCRQRCKFCDEQCLCKCHKAAASVTATTTITRL